MSDRDCNSCINHTNNGCASWECEYVPRERWIPCSQRLPEDGFYLVTNEWHKLDFLYYRPDKGWHHGNMQDTEGRPSVIAWMPLPEPYMGGKEDE